MVETGNLLVGMVFLAEGNGLPSRRLETRIDAIRFGGDFIEEIFVALDIRPARRTNLHERKTLLVSRIQFEESFQSAEPLKDSFGVVDAIHANSQMRGLNSHFLAQGAAQRAGAVWIDVCPRIFRKRHANGIGAHARDVTLAVYGKAVPFRKRFQSAVDRLQEIVAVRLNVKANQVGAQQPVNEFTLPWANPEDFGVWPGDMPENRDAGVWANFLNHARNQCQVIVLRQKNRRIHVRHFLQNSIGEPLVNPLVLQPVLGTENRPGVRDVAERPKSFDSKRQREVAPEVDRAS